MGVFLRGNSSDNPDRRGLLESPCPGRVLLLAAPAAMSIDAAACAGYASLLGSLLGSFEVNSGPEGTSGAAAWTAFRSRRSSARRRSPPEFRST